MTDSAIVMPKLGLTMSEGLIAEWNVKAGDEVAAGQLLFVVETDKISNEIEAPAAGRINKILVEAGETAAVGAPVALWTGPGQERAESGAAKSPKTSLPQQALIAAERRSTAEARILSTPVARRLARQGGIDIQSCKGSGPRGRIQAADVRAVLERNAVPMPAKSRSLRSLIAARVSRSKAEVPHFYLSADALFDPLATLRQQLNADPAARSKISVTAFLVAAVARALQTMPEANVVWRGGELVPLSDVAVGIAVETDAGVMAPVLPLFSSDSIHDTAVRLDGAIGRARGGRLGPADTGDAAIGISNVGMLAVRSLTPIIDPDQTFMLGVGGPRATFRADAQGRPTSVQEVTLTLACDHRAIDGAAAARFLARIVELIEQPARLLMQID